MPICEDVGENFYVTTFSEDVGKNKTKLNR